MSASPPAACLLAAIAWGEDGDGADRTNCAASGNICLEPHGVKLPWIPCRRTLPHTSGTRITNRRNAKRGNPAAPSIWSPSPPQSSPRFHNETPQGHEEDGLKKKLWGVLFRSRGEGMTGRLGGRASGMQRSGQTVVGGVGESDRFLCLARKTSWSETPPCEWRNGLANDSHNPLKLLSSVVQHLCGVSRSTMTG